jgi:beta-galactosidase
MLFYRALRSLGVDVDIRHPDHDLAGYDLLVAPALQLMGPERAAHLAGYADTAQIVFGPRTAFRTPTGRVHEDGQPGPLRPLVGWSLLNFDGMRPGLTTRVGGKVVETWAEAYRVVDGETLATYDVGPLAGEAAVVRRGNVVTIGAWSMDLVTEVLAGALGRAGIAVTPLPEGVRRSRRGGVEIWMNFNQDEATLPDGSTIPPVSFKLRG